MKKLIICLILLSFIIGCDNMPSLKSERGNIYFFEVPPVETVGVTDSLTEIEGKPAYKFTVGDENDEVIIGDEKSDKFVPNMKLTRWNGEESLTIKYSKTNFDPPVVDKDKVKISNHTEDIEFYKADDKNYKMVIYVKKKPLDNKFSYYIEGWEDFNFYYQPIWEDYETVEINGEEYQEKTLPSGMKVRRKPEIAGSYAIYHKTKANHVKGQTNYKTGKFKHAYTPKWIDANGKWTWGKLSFKDGWMTNECPWEFINSAKLPIKSNDTYGDTSEGGSETGWAANYSSAFNVYGTMPANGTITAVHIWIRYDTANQDLVYNYYGNDNNKSSASDGSGTFGNVDNDHHMYEYAISGDTEGSGDKLSCAYGFDGAAPNIAADATAGTENAWRDSSWQSPITLTATEPSTNGEEYQYSVYMTYTPSGGEEEEEGAKWPTNRFEWQLERGLRR